MLAEYLTCLSAVIGGSILGTTIGWSGTAIPLLSAANNATGRFGFFVSEADCSWIASLMPIGALVGGSEFINLFHCVLRFFSPVEKGPAAGMICRMFGRRITLFVVCGTFSIFYVLLTAAVSVGMVFAGRFGTGLATGAAAVIIPIYVAETASASRRGLLGACFQVMVVTGVLYVDIVGYFGAWRWLSASALVLCAVWAVALLFVPETPSYLVSNSRLEAAKKALTVSKFTFHTPVNLC